MSISINDFQNLKQQHTQISNKIIELNTKKQVAMQQVAEILQKHGVTSIADLQNKYEAKKIEATALQNEITAYLQETSQVIQNIELKLTV